MKSVLGLLFATALTGASSLGVWAQENAPVTTEDVATDTAEATDALPQLQVVNAAEISLETYLWTNRLIIVFANSELDPNFRKQLELLQERPAELIERDVIVVTDTDPANPSDARLKLRPRAFGMVFVDKDGVVKLRKPSPWDVREISRSIDKTELRQQEVRDAREAQQ